MNKFGNEEAVSKLPQWAKDIPQSLYKTFLLIKEERRRRKMAYFQLEVKRISLYQFPELASRTLSNQKLRWFRNGNKTWDIKVEKDCGAEEEEETSINIKNFSVVEVNEQDEFGIDVLIVEGEVGVLMIKFKDACTRDAGAAQLKRAREVADIDPGSSDHASSDDLPSSSGASLSYPSTGLSDQDLTSSSPSIPSEGDNPPSPASS